MKRIVIVGAGSAGIRVAQVLAKSLSESDNIEVVVLEKSAYYYHVVGAPRAFVDTSYTNKMFIPYDNAIPKHAAKFVRIVRGVATRISAVTNEVSYHAIGSDDQQSAATETLQFNYLVLATGSTYSALTKPDSHNYARSATEAKLQEVRGHIEKAGSVLVVGGGAVGCEVAAEIKAKYPAKTVTIVDANDKLDAWNNLRDKFDAYLDASLDKLDVKVVLGERLTE
ncbi:unnamed protein product [Phytophthora fragariaefolia]|uniref:Unnamed protein product n=1 Tax=Phytophthora fragariaefolia TaxID=1490495 RepID=A0A9W6XIA1_9STRA|nr:unnamed protein product [Phytophthora fragariaefolia]